MLVVVCTCACTNLHKQSIFELVFFELELLAQENGRELFGLNCQTSSGKWQIVWNVFHLFKQSAFSLSNKRDYLYTRSLFFFSFSVCVSCFEFRKWWKNRACRPLVWGYFFFKKINLLVKAVGLSSVLYSLSLSLSLSLSMQWICMLSLIFNFSSNKCPCDFKIISQTKEKQILYIYI